MNATSRAAPAAGTRTFRMAMRTGQAWLVAGFMLISAIALALTILLVPQLSLQRAWMHVATAIAAAVFVLWIQGVMAACRLTVDDRGIRMENGRKGGLAALFLRSWSVGWKEIGHVTANAALGLVQIRRKGSVASLSIMVRKWTPEDAPLQPVMSGLLRRGDPTQAELWRVLQARGLFDPERYGAGRGMSDFDLGKHPATRWALVACIAMLGYGLADLGIHPKREYLVPSMVTAAFAAALTFILLFRVDRPYPVPVGVTTVVALLAAGTATIAAWAALSHFAP